MVLPIAVITTSSTRWSSLSSKAGAARRMASIAALVDIVSPARNLESADETSSWAVKSTTGTLETMFIGLLRHEPCPARMIRRMAVSASEIVVRPEANRTGDSKPWRTWFGRQGEPLFFGFAPNDIWCSGNPFYRDSTNVLLLPIQDHTCVMQHAVNERSVSGKAGVVPVVDVISSDLIAPLVRALTVPRASS